VCVCEHTTIKFRVSSFVRAAGRSYGCTVATPRPRPTRIPLHAWKLERPCGGAAAGGSTARSAGRAAAAGLAVVRPGVAERAGELKPRTVPVIINKGSHIHMAAPCASAGDAAAAEPPCLSSPHWPPHLLFLRNSKSWPLVSFLLFARFDRDRPCSTLLFHMPSVPCCSDRAAVAPRFFVASAERARTALLHLRTHFLTRGSKPQIAITQGWTKENEARMIGG